MSQAAKISAVARRSVIPLGVYALSRLVDTFILLGLRSKQTTDPDFLHWPGVVPIQVQPRTYSNIIANWDGQWYELIAKHGYPHVLSTYSNGQVVQNQWAFYPGFPMLCRLLMQTGMSFAVSAIVVNLIAGAIGCCLLYALVRTSGSTFTATMAVVGFCFFPTAFVLQAAYSEALAFALIVGALFALNRRRYSWFMICTIALSLTRPVALPLAAVAGLHALLRWVRRNREPFEPHERTMAVASTAVALVSFGVWPMIAALVTGRWDAYWVTARTWSNDGHWVSWLSETSHIGGQGVMLFTVVIVLAMVTILTQRGARAWPTELRAWSGMYVLYLLASTRVTPSITRYLMLAILPGWPAPDLSERRLPVPVMIAIGLCLAGAGVLVQIGWLGSDFIVGPDWRGYP